MVDHAYFTTVSSSHGHISDLNTFLVEKTLVPPTVNNNDVYDGITYLLHGAESARS